jgi:hypothetical protein
MHIIKNNIKNSITEIFINSPNSGILNLSIAQQRKEVKVVHAIPKTKLPLDTELKKCGFGISIHFMLSPASNSLSTASWRRIGIFPSLFISPS